MGKLSPVVKDKIIEQNDVEQLYFDDAVRYFCKKSKEDSYKQLARVRS